MSARSRSSLGRRADAAGLLVSGGNVPLTFQRTLMPRTTVDQAIVTGLSISTNQALVTLVQESIQAAALLLLRDRARKGIDRRTWSRASIAFDLGTVGAGVALQRAFRQRPREPLERAAVRTAGFWLSVSGTAGAVVGALDETLPTSRTRRRSLALLLPTAGVLAGAVEYGRRRRARLDAGLPPDESQVATAKALAFGVGVTAGTASLSALERFFADRIAEQLARVLPGDVSLWKPVGHAASLAGFVAGARFAAQQVFGRIESREEAVETAFDIAPPTPMVSGSYESLVPFETLAVQGRRFAWMVTPVDVIEQVVGEPATAQPIRVYVGLQSAPTGKERVDLALHELDRTGAFDRSYLMVVSPTGTGYVNYAAVSALEFLTRGDCATVAMQYAARPSVLSLSRVDEGREHMRLLLDGIGARLASRPVDRRPKLVLFGESLGAWTSQDPFVGCGTAGLVDAGIDHAIWIGTPHFSKWKEQVLRDERDDVDRDLVGVFNDIGEWHALDATARDRIRFVMITHHDDGVALFGPELTIQAPEWLGDPATRPSSVPKGMRWMPTTTFFQVLTDMKNSANVVPGVFAAKGHDYRADLLPFFHAVLGFKDTTAQLAAIDRWLQQRERQRSEWISDHGKVERSLSATVLQRLIDRERAAGRDPDARIIELMREVANEELAQQAAPAPTAP